LAPVVLGWIRLQGQRAGLYDTAFGLALMVISLITTLTIFILFNAGRLTRLEHERRQVDEHLHTSEVRYRSTLENMMEGCQIIDHDWRYLFLNDSAVAQSHLSREQLLGRTMMECYPGIEKTDMFRKLQECMDQRISSHMVNEFIYPHGETGWFELSIQPAPDGIFILSTDITKHKRSEAALLERERKLTTLFEILPVGISILDADRRVTYTNPALKRILAISDEGLRQGRYRDRTYLKGNGEPMQPEEMASTRAFQEGQEIEGVETGVVKEDGTVIWTEVSAVPVDFADWRLVLMTRDITDRKEAETEILKLNEDLEKRVADRTAELAQVNAHLQRLSLYDELTGLYNRRGFLLLAEEQLALARRAHWDALVFYGDLDGLKPINDEMGHRAGDQAIITAAQALQQTFRASDIKARLGGDEFIVLAFQLQERTGQKILARLHENLAHNNQSMSMGMVALHTMDGITLHDLIASADAAMYAQKRSRSRRDPA
jgi:diguanylate cyclase (GGDEF)-like protein/PAS domain S-box-containing protein